MDDKLVCRFYSFIKHCYNNIQGNEEQNPLAVVRLPEDLKFLLKQLKKRIADKLPGFNKIKIIPLIHQELIYRSPGASQQKVVACCSIWLQTENCNAFDQGANRSQMLVCYDSVPPPQWLTSGGGWYIVSMDVVMDRIKPDGRCLDNKVHMKVYIRIAHGRMTWPPTPANNVDSDFSPCDIYLHKENYIYNNDFSTCNIHLPTETHIYNNVLNSGFPKYCGANTLNPEESNQLGRLRMFNLNSFVPNSRMVNTGATYEDHQDESTNGKSKICPPSPIIRAGYSASSSIRALLCCYLLASAAAHSVPQGQHIKFQIVQDDESHQNCTLNTSMCFICYGDCDRNIEQNEKRCNRTNLNLVEEFCTHQMKSMKTNYLSLLRDRHLTSGTLQRNLSCELDENFNVTTEISPYIFNGNIVSNNEMADMPISNVQEMTGVENLCETYRKELFPSRFDQTASPPGSPPADIFSPASPPGSGTNVTSVDTVAIVVPIVVVIIVIVAVILLVGYLKYLGKISRRKVEEICSKITYGPAAQSDSKDDAMKMQARRTDNLVV